ncbi:MAG: AbrB/MazE/SpoVT family DNA-binding domain-containing protein [Armatimonadota bacterium]|nr:AbrB/MazE/SpoVT family DNA-binding domain-containing protein [Armatimonadota bacterium]
MKDQATLEHNFFGAATVGDRGQVVIPAEARKKLGINPGDKLLVLGHPMGAGLVLCKIDKARDLLAFLTESLKTLERAVMEAGADAEAP